MDVLIKKIFAFYRLLILTSIIYISSKENQIELNYFIDNYYSSYENKIINLELDRYISGIIEGNNSDYYNITLPKDSEQIIVDYQSKYGCLSIFFNEYDIINETEYDLILCSEGIDSIFYINKSEIFEIIGEKGRDTLHNINIILGVGYSNSETNKINFKYSLKISLRTETVPIYKINSEHKILCKTERINDNKFKCLFVFIYNTIDNNDSNDKNIILYPIVQSKNMKLNIYADFIDKEYYDDWNAEFLLENMPNINSYYNNCFTEQYFIYIPINDTNKYIYICVESNDESTIEMLTQVIYKNDEIKLPEINEMKIYSIYKKFISFDNNILINNYNSISVTFGILRGKVSINWEYDNSKKYIIDGKENLLINLNSESCQYKDKCNLVVNDLEYNDEKNDSQNLGDIFYITIIQNNDNVISLDEIEYGKSMKFCYENRAFPIMLYSQINYLDCPLNINFQIYEFYNLNSNEINSTRFEINVVLLSIKDIYNIKKDPSQIILNNSIKGYFDPSLLASNIYLSIEDLKKFNIKENPCVFIYISNNYNNVELEKLILGSTISQINSLIKPSERIYHYGDLKNEEKIVYRLGGRPELKLMRLEIGLNSNNINWSVKRINDNNYKYNDSDISFVTEKWINGRGLATIYIEKGEDIYLTFFNKNRGINNLTNYIFKYINAKKNSEFKNYYIKKDTLSFNKEYMRLTANQIKYIPNSSISYYLKIIEEEDYINNELLKAITIGQSYCKSAIKGAISGNKIIFYVNNQIDEYKKYYLNVYSHILDNNFDIEYISYNGLFINLQSKNKSNKLLYIIIGLASGILFFILCILIICIIRIRRRNRILREVIARIDFAQESYEDDNIDDDDLLE